MKPLTPKQEKFANLYVELGNASEAYRQAYDVKPNTKDESVNVSACKLLADPNITLRVDELRKDLQESHKVTREWIRQQHMEIVDWYKELKEFSRRDNLTKAEVSRVYMLKDLIKGSDFRGSLDSITKMYGLNEVEKSEVKQTIEIVEKKRED